jgi:hypothetical protein
MRFWITKNSESPVREQFVRQVILGILSEDLPGGRNSQVFERLRGGIAFTLIRLAQRTSTFGRKDGSKLVAAAGCMCGDLSRIPITEAGLTICWQAFLRRERRALRWSASRVAVRD